MHTLTRTDWLMLFFIWALCWGVAECAQAEEKRVGSKEMYPDPFLTPGAVRTTDIKDLCIEGEATKLRKKYGPTAKQKCLVYRAHGLPCESAKRPLKYQVDHWVSLCLGGAVNGLSNLWPMPYPAASWKDGVEAHWCREICAGRLTVEEAQRQEKEDWYKAWLDAGKPRMQFPKKEKGK